ncbi:MAG TPA: ATP-binding protein [Ideonella sp.]|nr:ATP-binding protein [Ideonella sp.]
METYPVPEAALREAVTNAIVHKDYASGTPVQISVYNDKLMIWNAGELPQNWTLARLTAKHASVPYNPDIANTFFRAALLESWGRGIDLIRQACEAQGAPAPHFDWDNGLWVVFPFGLPVPTPEVTPEVTGVVTGEVGPEADPRTRLVLVLKGDMGRLALQQALRLKDAEHFRRRYLLPALAAGLIEMTRPDKPQSRLQTYRLTPKGKSLRTKALSAGSA